MRIKLQYFLPYLLSLLFISISLNGLAQQPMGEGIVKPWIGKDQVLRLYTGTLKYHDLIKTLPPDSIVIKQGKNNFEIASAPPWFLPEISMLDYDILQLRATIVSRDWIEVIVNTKNNKRAWVRRDSVDYLPWADFLLSVFSIELINPSQNPLRLKPLDNASVILNVKDASLRAQAISGDWAYVTIIDEDPDKEMPSGWIRWTKGNLFLIRWSLLS